MLWYIFELFIDIIEASIFVRFGNSTFSKRYNGKLLYYVYGFIIVLIIFTFDICINEEEDWSTFLIMIILIFIVFYIMYDETILKLLSGYIGILLLMVAVEGITITLLSFIFKVSTTMFVEKTLYKLMAMVLAKLIIFLIVGIWISRYKRDGIFKISKSLSYYIIALFVSNITIMICVISSSINNNIVEDSMIRAGYITLGLGIINMLSLLIYETIVIESQKYWKMKLRVQQYDMQSKYFDDINNATMKLKGLRHDMSNHLGNIKGLIMYKEYTKLEEYLNRILTEIDEVDKIIITKYPAISALLNRKYALANKHNINCSINIGNIDNLTIDDVDLCIVLGNLLDNAIEANLKIEECHRNISLDINTRNKYIIINSVNSTLSGNTSLCSTKDNKDMHGIGLKNVQQVVEKYYGIMEIDAIKDYFNVSIILYNGKVVN